MANVSKHAAALLLLLPLTACVLVVPAPHDDLSATCSLTQKESESTCGRCVENNCQEALDDCCAAGEACEPIVHDLVSCEVYETCETPGRGRAETALRACVAGACRTSCNIEQYDETADAGASTAGLVCRTDDVSCSCKAEADSASSGTRCPTGLYDDWLCCASTGYPAPGTSCACSPIECMAQDGYCACALADSLSLGEPTSACTSSGTCCLGSSACTCDDTRDECPSGTTTVTVCSASRFSCSAGSHQVDGCSAE